MFPLFLIDVGSGTLCVAFLFFSFLFYRTGTLVIQKCVVRFRISSGLHYPLYHPPDSALRILSGCQYNIIANMITERNSIACRLITKALSKVSLGACIVSQILSMDIFSRDCLAQQDLQIPENTTKKIPDT